MTFTSTIRSGARLAAVTPSLWVYGLISACCGSAIMVSALLAAFPQFQEPVGHGMVGWLVLGAVMAVSVAVEAAACRAAAGKGTSGGAALDARRLLPRATGLVPALIVMAMLFCLVVAVPVFAFLRTFLAALLMMIFPFAVHMTIILGSAIAALALLVPAWMLFPLAVRAMGIYRRGVWESIGDAMSVIGERTGATVLCGLLCIALDAALLVGGSRVAARDLSLTGHFHVLAAWNGTRAGAGVLMLGLTAVAAAFKAGMWTAVYLDVAQQQKWSEESPAAPPRGDLARLWIFARRAARDMCRSAVPFILAALVVLIGMPIAADLLSVYHLVPRPADESASPISRQLPGGGTTALILFVPAMLMSIFCSAALVAATGPLARRQSARLGASFAVGLRRFLRVLGATVMLYGTVAMVGGILLVGVLFGMALVVQFAKGLNQLADQFGYLVGIAVVAVPVILTPFVTRAVVLEGLPPGKALERGFDLATSRPRVILLVFLLTASLDVLRGPVASWAGLLTSGWSEVYALAGFVHPPMARAALGYSAVALILTTIAVAFAAQLWTEVYTYASVGKGDRNEAAEVGPSEYARTGVTEVPEKRRRKRRREQKGEGD
jgi:hypothetical protein